MKIREKVRNLLEAVPDKPTERHTKEELLKWCDEAHDIMTSMRSLLMDVAATTFVHMNGGRLEE